MMAMAHRRFEFEMPANASVVFDAFHYLIWRHRWDSLVRRSRVLGDAPCPHVGAITENDGGGWLRALSMRTQFIAYDRPHVAAAKMIGTSFPFRRWAASMKHKPISDDRSLMIYTYSFETTFAPLGQVTELVVQRVFDAQTDRRFARLQRFLSSYREEIAAWQQTRQ
jgi:hypothetical protein